MQIVGMAGMSDDDMAAREPVLMAVLFMLGAGAHGDAPVRDAA
jgi:hypothetical protein